MVVAGNVADYEASDMLSGTRSEGLQYSYTACKLPEGSRRAMSKVDNIVNLWRGVDRALVVAGNVAVLGDRERLEERLVPAPRLPILHPQ